MKKIKIIILSIALSATIMPIIGNAAVEGFLKDTTFDCQVNGNCTVCEIVLVGITIFKWLMGIVGGAALMMFIWQGFRLMSSEGEAEKIKTARNGMVHTIIGIFIVFFSWLIVNSVIIILTNPSQLFSGGGIATIFDSKKAWNDYCNNTK